MLEIQKDVNLLDTLSTPLLVPIASSFSLYTTYIPTSCRQTPITTNDCSQDLASDICWQLTPLSAVDDQTAQSSVWTNSQLFEMPHNFIFYDCDEELDIKLLQLEFWEHAPDLSTLFGLNKSYINGSLIIHPGHAVPLYAESKALKRKLIELNEHGLFTFQGQPKTKGEYKGPHSHDEDGDDCDVKIDLTEWKAYCRCCAGMPKC